MAFWSVGHAVVRRRCINNSGWHGNSIPWGCSEYPPEWPLSLWAWLRSATWEIVIPFTWKHDIHFLFSFCKRIKEVSQIWDDAQVVIRATGKSMNEKQEVKKWELENANVLFWTRHVLFCVACFLCGWRVWFCLSNGFLFSVGPSVVLWFGQI